MPFLRGARLSSRQKLAAAHPHVAVVVPPNFARLAKTLQLWGNDQYGDCVTAEEAAAKSQDGIVYTDAEIVANARKYGNLDGADLATVLDQWAAHGCVAPDGTAYKDGGKQSVGYTDWTTLCSGIYQGQVKIAVAAQQLEDAGGGNSDGWMLLKADRDSGIDHCVGLVGYGTHAFCCQQLGVAVSTNHDPNTPSVILFTWGTYGVVSFDALLAVMDSTPTYGNSEAWVRIPQTAGIGPAPTPAPTPAPAPIPSPCPWSREDVDHYVTTVVRAVARGIKEGIRA